jgi:transporter family protein
LNWLALSLLSAVLLGLYDFLKKSALRDNAVLPVLCGGIWAGALVWLPFILWSALASPTLPHPALHVTGITPLSHLHLFLKSGLVVTSWVFGYVGLKSLPLTIATPIRSTGPLWTIALAVLLFHEHPSPRQWLGITIVLVSFFAFSLAGKLDGIHFHRNRAVLYIIAATLLGACSALFDKYLLQTTSLTPTEVQAWFSLYSALIMIPVLLWWRSRPERNRFHWRWSIPAIGLALLAADLLYFTAVSQPDALISLISPVRRSAVIVSFLLGIFLLKEKHILPKLLCILGILAGVFLLS